MFKLLAARLVVFTAAILWVIGWLVVGLLGWNSLIEWLLEVDPTWIVIPLEVWYIATIVIVGAWVAMKGFRFVGKWTRE